VRAVAQSLGRRGALREGIDVRSATDVLYTIGGPEKFRQLVRERGWTPARYERWLVEAAGDCFYSAPVKMAPCNLRSDAWRS
jgi:hypothetical protein